MKQYIRVFWHHAFPDEPTQIFSESEDGIELRKIEIFRDGRVGFADGVHAQGGSILAEGLLPDFEEVNSQSDFSGTRISEHEFNQQWIRREQNPSFMPQITAEDVTLLLAEAKLSFIGIDLLITLRFDNGSVVQLETLFSLTDVEGKVTRIDPEGDKGALIPVLRLFDDSVQEADIAGSVLTLRFACGAVLEAGPDENFESWSYTGPESLPTRVIAMPGGGIAIWLPGKESAAAGENE